MLRGGVQNSEGNTTASWASEATHTVQLDVADAAMFDFPGNAVWAPITGLESFDEGPQEDRRRRGMSPELGVWQLPRADAPATLLPRSWLIVEFSTG